MSETMTFDTHDRTSLFCFSVWTTIKVEDVEGDFHFAKRKNMGTWINTGMYKQIWKASAQKGDYAAYDLTVKADADAVFFPKKLVECVYLQEFLELMASHTAAK